MSKFERIMLIISSIFLPCLGIVLILFHKKLDMEFVEAALFMLVFIELSNSKQFQLEVKSKWVKM